MKGNIGPTKKLAIDSTGTFANQQKKLFSKMADEFDIDKVIPRAQQTTKTKQENIAYSEGSFNLSINNDDIESQYAHSENAGHGNTVFANRMSKLADIPGLDNDAGSSGLITSDSQFEVAA